MAKLIITLSAAIVVTLTTMAADLSKYIPSTAPMLECYDNLDSLKVELSHRPLTDIEGLWQMTQNNSIVIIEPATLPDLTIAGGDVWQIVLVSSPRKSLFPGTVLGYITPSARKDRFDAWMYTTGAYGVLKHHSRLTLDLTDELHISLIKPKSKWRATVRHSFYFLFRASVSARTNGSDIDNTPIDGFIKLYPAANGKPLKPVYL